MNKKEIFELIEAYRPSYSEEIYFREKILDFVQSHTEPWDRKIKEGHLTVSVWLLNSDQTKAFLIHHLKLDRWLQIGGHIEEQDDSLQTAALREALEESGLEGIRLLSPSIYDLDIHLIPERKNEAAHWHYDIRFLAKTDYQDFTTAYTEIKAAQWLDLSLPYSHFPASISRMIEKTPH
jgi:8-oxo-dGTP pyrophosphatase MutT (NUDIX family)